MAGRRAKTRAGAKGASPVLALPPNTDRKTRQKLGRLIDLELAKAEGREPPAPRPFRFRFHLVPLCWLAAGLAGIAWHGGTHSPWITGLCALLNTAITVATTRERDDFPRRYNQGMAAWTSLWFLLFSAWGSGWWTAAFLAGWLIPSCLWWEKYRWRGPAPEKPKPDTSIEDTWARLCLAQKWDATLGDKIVLGEGAAQWPIHCDGISTHIGKITAKRQEVAAAFHKSVTSCFTEPDPRADDESRGLLTILPRGVLDDPRLWDGLGIDLATGLAVVGRFPDGSPVRERYFVRGLGGGAKHTIIAGCDGSGKTGMIDMGLCISAASGIIAPVILDPQEGQALPAWRDVVPYAAGVDECMTYLRGLHAAMFDRSAELAGLYWTHPKSGKRVKGFGFYDYWMIARARAEAAGLKPDDLTEGELAAYALPIIEITIDEAPILLAMKGAPALLLDILKLGRKVGFRVRLAVQVPSIKELGGSGELRSILVGGNVICFRTGDKVSHGMANIPANPNELPKFWRNGQPTVGLGFASTGDNIPRPSVTMRTDYVDDPYSYAEEAQPASPDESVASRLARVLSQADADAADLASQAEDQAQIILGILAMLARPMTQGQIISQSTWRVSEVVDAIKALHDAGKIRETADLIHRVDG
jgi:hypothetical protein